MDHGRSHDERRQKAERPRANNLPADADTELEAELELDRRGGMQPPQGLVGAHEERVAGHALTQEPLGRGKEVAPTARAARREQERHRLEGMLGADGDARRQVRPPGVSRRDLDEAARQADRFVTEERRSAGAQTELSGDPPEQAGGPQE